MDFYKRNFVGVLSFRLNYPPEEAQSLIRDQTQSNFLEEIVHFGKQSLYINGFVPTKATEQINRNGVHYTTKVTVRYIPSGYVTRLTTLLLLSLVTLSLVKALWKSINGGYYYCFYLWYRCTPNFPWWESGEHLSQLGLKIL